MECNKKNILFLCPLKGNGGIASWANNLIESFNDNDFHLFPLDIAPSKDFTKFRGYERIIVGVCSFFRIRRDIIRLIKKSPQFKLAHIATGGGMGVLRDYFIGRLLSKQHYKLILHCH